MFRQNNGRSIVEAALIFPIIFLAGIVLFYSAVLLSEYAYLQSLVDISAHKGAEIYDNPKKDIVTGKVNKNEIKDGELYWRIINFQKETKSLIVQKYVENRLKRHPLLVPAESAKVKVNMNNFIGYSKLEVEISREYVIPSGNLLKMFGMKKNYSVCVKSQAVINQPAEFIRNTDFIVDIEKEMEKKYPEYGKIIEKIREKLRDTQKAVDSFFEKEK